MIIGLNSISSWLVIFGTDNSKVHRPNLLNLLCSTTNGA